MRLVKEAQADPAPPVGFDALLQARIVKVAESAEHSGQSIGLSTVRVEAKLVGLERHGSDAFLGRDVGLNGFRADVPD